MAMKGTRGLACVSQQQFHTMLPGECEHNPHPSHNHTISAASTKILWSDVTTTSIM